MKNLFEQCQDLTDGKLDAFSIEVAEDVDMARYKAVLGEADIAFTDKVESVDESQKNYLVFETEDAMVKAQAAMQASDLAVKEAANADPKVMSVDIHQSTVDGIRNEATRDDIFKAVNDFIMANIIEDGKVKESSIKVNKVSLTEKKEVDAKAKAKADKIKAKEEKEAKITKEKITKLEGKPKKAKDALKKDKEDKKAKKEVDTLEADIKKLKKKK